MAGDELGHGVHVAGLRSAALQVAVLEMRGRHLQRVADPLAGRETRSSCAAPMPADAAARP